MLDLNLNTQCISRLTEIHELLGALTYSGAGAVPREPRSTYWTRTVHATLSIEGSPLTQNQVAQLGGLDPKTQWERAAKNALRAYQGIKSFTPTSERSLLAAHKAFMDGLLPRAGRYRNGGVALQQAGRIVHVAPPASAVPGLMKALMNELKRPHFNPIVASCAFHYELEFLHPFSDGNGRLGRFWHTVLLRQVHPIFDQLSIESVLDRERDGYYRALSASDKAGHALPFVEFMLDVLAESLRNLLYERPSPPQTSEARIQYFVEYGPQHFTRSDYLAFFPSLSAPTASRDLRTGTASAHWVRYGDKRTTSYVIPRPNEYVNDAAPIGSRRRKPASNPDRPPSSDEVPRSAR